MYLCTQLKPNSVNHKPLLGLPAIIMSNVIDAFQTMPKVSSNDTSHFISDLDAEIRRCIVGVRDLLPKDEFHESYDRKKLRNAASKLQLALELPTDTVQRVSYLV